jgi:hypothetical protein
MGDEAVTYVTGRTDPFRSLCVQPNVHFARDVPHLRAPQFSPSR